MPEADQWGEKMWKPTYFEFHGGGPGADTPRFFSPIGDAFGIVLLTKQFSGVPPCSIIALAFLQPSLVSATVVLPTAGDDQ